MEARQSYVYLLMNKTNSVIYTGVTADLKKRIVEHKEKIKDGFTKKYNVTKLVYYEIFESIEDAIEREKQRKAGSRRKKEELIRQMNPGYKDLYNELC